MPTITLIQANSLHIPLPDSSVHCCVTSPPYWGLRQYAGVDPTIWNGDSSCHHEWGNTLPEHHPGQVPDSKWTSNPNLAAGQTAGSGQFCQLCGGWRGCLGLEPTPELYIEHLTQIFREVRRVLRDDGTLWLNLGDSYATNSAGSLKPKDLVGIPWRVAFALQADGWWLRSDVIWAKGVSFCGTYSGSVMPESVNGWRWERHRVKVRQLRQTKPGTWGNGSGRNDRDSGDIGNNPWAEYTDCPGCPKCELNNGYVLRYGSWRPTKAHEYVFMLAKSADYFCDADAVRESGGDGSNRWGGPVMDLHTTKAFGGESVIGNAANRPLRTFEYNGTRNPRTVWTINTGSYSGAHYAVFPTTLVEPCIKAATSEYGVCSTCGAPYARIVEREFCGEYNTTEAEMQRKRNYTSGGVDKVTLGGRTKDVTREHRGWLPTCDCAIADPVPATVLDIFGGSGTSALVARDLGRNAILLDLSHQYLHNNAYERLGLAALDAWNNGIQIEEQDLTNLPLFAGGE